LLYSLLYSKSTTNRTSGVRRSAAIHAHRAAKIVCDFLRTVPSGVASLSVAERGSNHLTVTWAPPEFPNGKLLDYFIEYRVGE